MGPLNYGVYQNTTNVKVKDICVLVILNELSKLLLVFPFPKGSLALKAAQLFLHHIYKFHKLSSIIIRDSGPVLMSKF